MSYASEASLPSEWLKIHDPAEKFECSFPYQPTHMEFDVPLEGHEELGHLDVYSTSKNHDLWMLSVYSSAILSKNVLKPSHFKEIFYSLLIQRMFYTPQVFKSHQKFKTERTTWKGAPVLRFSFSYEEKEQMKQVEGAAVVKDQTLYILFYLSKEDDFNNDLVGSFINSFTLN